jgi:hypothetical protein
MKFFIRYCLEVDVGLERGELMEGEPAGKGGGGDIGGLRHHIKKDEFFEEGALCLVLHGGESKIESDGDEAKEGEPFADPERPGKQAVGFVTRQGVRANDRQQQKAQHKLRKAFPQYPANYPTKNQKKKQNTADLILFEAGLQRVVVVVSRGRG